MKMKKIIRSVAALILCTSIIYSCKKETEDLPQIPPPNKTDITGNWTIYYHVAANIIDPRYTTNDTVYSQHNETWQVTSDSILTHTWYSAWYDQTKNPAQFWTSDSLELTGRFKYTLNGKYIYGTLGSRVDTMDIVSQSTSELKVHSKVNRQFGYTDSYLVLKK